MNDIFESAFLALTENRPLSWQRRLFAEFAKGRDQLPSIVDLPTGLGKTMIMAIWLIARAQKFQVPTRLIYVVDRRTVVDQATDLTKTLVKNWNEHKIFEGPPPAISTLRGQLADNREWSADPSRPAIVIGTVDLIGSALLFCGYRSSFKRRPLEAGLLGQDSLLVLDEAHLSKPFEKLICAIGDEGAFQKDCVGKMHGQPMRVIRMSATSGQLTASKPPFGLKIDASGNLAGEDAKDNIISDRFEAKKRLNVITLSEKDDLNKHLAEIAISLAENSELVGKRMVVFVRKPESAMKIADLIQKHNPTKLKPAPFANSVEVLTGTMRGLERDELVEKPVFESRWLNGSVHPSDEINQKPVFLISTSAGEVGFDLNADHLVGDAAPLDSWMQRLGRVNRRGNGNATVVLINEKDPLDKTDFDKACIAASKLLIDGMDVSPRALAVFKNKLQAEEIDESSSPTPTMVDLTDILLDAWSMTSIAERMPGRPEVGPWLRGIADELPQTTIAWRAELDIDGFRKLDFEDIEEWYDTHAIRTHESLSVPTSAAAKWFAERWATLTELQKSVVGDRSIIVDRGGLKLITVQTLIDQLARKNVDSILNAELIVPASFGGIERRVGLLDPSAPHKPLEKTVTDEETSNKNISADVADEHGRSRELVTKSEEGIPKTCSIGSGAKPSNPARFVLELESSDDTRVQLVSWVPKRDKPEWGSERQTLSKHVGLVRKRIDEILCRLDLPEPLNLAAELAADYHDHGKNRERWQRLIDNAFATPPGEKWTNQTIGKSGGLMKRDARYYRHEFGSLREFIDAHHLKIDAEVFDLAMHLIATHHGRGRPHFPKGAFDPDAEARSPEIHAEVIRRFARLQRKYGWWRLAWLENLLRCADALASGDDV